MKDCAICCPATRGARLRRQQRRPYACACEPVVLDMGILRLGMGGGQQGSSGQQSRRCTFVYKRSAHVGETTWERAFP